MLDYQHPRKADCTHCTALSVELAEARAVMASQQQTITLLRQEIARLECNRDMVRVIDTTHVGD